MKAISCGILTVALAVSAHADLAYSSFGPGDSFNVSSGWSIGGSIEQRVAFQFTSASTGVLASVEFAYFTGAPGTLNVELFEDSSDTIGNQMVVWGTSPSGPITTLNNVFPSVALTAGNKYWLQVSGVTSTGANGGWNLNDQNLFSNAYYWSTSGSGYTSLQTSAFRVNTVPEPASMAALGLGALALVRKRRKNA